MVVWVAARLSLLGAKEEALDWLENAVHRGFINYPYLQCDPFFDNIRGECALHKADGSGKIRVGAF